jgi:hypothetical protein
VPDYSNWQVVKATLRSGVVRADDTGIALLDFMHHIFPPLAIITALVLWVRGHRADFLYTYAAMGKYYTGSARRFVRNIEQTPRLHGRAPGEAIFVRFDPDKPAVSIVLASDNP